MRSAFIPCVFAATAPRDAPRVALLVFPIPVPIPPQGRLPGVRPRLLLPAPRRGAAGAVGGPGARAVRNGAVRSRKGNKRGVLLWLALSFAYCRHSNEGLPPPLFPPAGLSPPVLRSPWPRAPPTAPSPAPPPPPTSAPESTSGTVPTRRWTAPEPCGAPHGGRWAPGRGSAQRRWRSRRRGPGRMRRARRTGFLSLSLASLGTRHLSVLLCLPQPATTHATPPAQVPTSVPEGPAFSIPPPRPASAGRGDGIPGPGECFQATRTFLYFFPLLLRAPHHQCALDGATSPPV